MSKRPHCLPAVYKRNKTASTIGYVECGWGMSRYKVACLHTTGPIIVKVFKKYYGYLKQPRYYSFNSQYKNATVTKNLSSSKQKKSRELIMRRVKRGRMSACLFFLHLLPLTRRRDSMTAMIKEPRSEFKSDERTLEVMSSHG